MQAFVAVLIPIIIIVAVGLIAKLINDRFSPDPTVTQIVNWIIYGIVLIMIITKLLPLMY